MVTRALESSGIARVGADLPPSVHLKSGVNAKGRRIHYLLNFSSEAKVVQSPFGGTDLLTGKSVAKGASLNLGPWDLAIVAE